MFIFEGNAKFQEEVNKDKLQFFYIHILPKLYVDLKLSIPVLNTK